MAAPILIHRFRAKSGPSAQSALPNGPAYRSRPFLIAPESNPPAREVLFRGADRGTVEGSSGTIPFERSLRLDEAGDSGAILAYVMNGEPLPIHHGFPLRLIVPSWYAVASVKWLTDIELIEQPFAGHFQMEKYWYEWRRGSEDAREPVTRMQVRALITEPNQGSEIERGDVTIRGVAWSGVAPIERVEVNTGGAWHRANLIGEPSRRRRMSGIALHNVLFGDVRRIGDDERKGHRRAQHRARRARSPAIGGFLHQGLGARRGRC